MEGHLIVLEGVDGAGTTTHSQRLVSALRARAVPVHGTQEPSGGPVGVLLRQALSGRVVAPGLSGPRAPDWTTMALLFAADRMDHLDVEILPSLRDGVTVVCDRYYHSSVAYQSVSGDGDGAIGWIRELNRHARRPDLTIVIDVPPEVAVQRRSGRRESEIYDGASLQLSLGGFYRELDQHFPDERIVHVAGDAPLEHVGDEILHHVLALRTA